MKKTAEHTVKLPHGHRLEVETFVDRETRLVVFEVTEFEGGDQIGHSTHHLLDPAHTGEIVDTRNKIIAAIEEGR